MQESACQQETAVYSTSIEVSKEICCSQYTSRMHEKARQEGVVDAFGGRHIQQGIIVLTHH